MTTPAERSPSPRKNVTELTDPELEDLYDELDELREIAGRMASTVQRGAAL